MKVFIVGASGVIGRTLIPSLTARGDDVVALVRSRERAAGIDVPGVELVEGDLLQIDDDRLTELLTGCDVAAHLATALRAGSPGLGTTNTNAALRIEGTTKLLEVVKRAGVARYIQQSIAFAYIDGGDEWIEESRALAPAPDGTVSVIEQMESIVRETDPSQVAWTILRGGTFTGPNTYQDDTIARMRAGTERMSGDGSHWVSFIHVDDYADAVLAAIDTPTAGSVFNVAAEPMRHVDYLARMAEILGVAPPTTDAEAPPARSYRCSSTAAREALGWSATRPIWPEASQLVPWVE